MAILLSLITAVVFGIGDFCGGIAAKRARVIQVVAGSHIVGALGAVAASLLLAERFDLGDVGLGVIGGGFGVVGVMLLYRRLAVGPMSVVAPLTAISSAVVPTAWGAWDGDRLSIIGWLGVALGLLAVLLVSLSPKGSHGPEGSAPITVAVVAESLLAGVGFGAMFIFLDATDAASAPWPVAGARVFTGSLMAIALVIAARRDGGPVVPTDRRSLVLIALVGLFDTSSNITFLYAANLGQLPVVSVLSALYPVSTVILARLLLAERMTRTQGLGFVAAIGATELLVIG